MDTRLEDLAKATASAHGMLPEGTPVLAMVSGGADSVALLRLLASGAFGPLAVRVLHVNHLLRDEAADRDADFVADACRRLGVECRVVRYDVAAYALSDGLNLEDAGRRVRYRFADEEIDAMCAEVGVPPEAGRIAVAHTFDDRLETFLMRLVSGAGAGGLLGIPHLRGRIVRPLLDTRRADVVGYLDGLGQEWREDATNADTTRVRARVRAALLPLLEAMNPRFDEALARTFAVLGEEDDLLDGMARAFAGDFTVTVPGEVRLDRSRMLSLTRAMQRRCIRMALIGAFPEASRIEYDHVEAIADGLAADTFVRDLPDGLRAFTEYGTLVISRLPGKVEAMAPSLLEIPGMVDLGAAGTIAARRSDPVRSDVSTAVVIDADRLTGPLTVDSMRPGDRMRPLGMGGTRKLQDVLTDAKVPRRLRPMTPVVRDGEAVVWVAGVRMSEDYAIGATTERAVRIEWTKRTMEDRA